MAEQPDVYRDWLGIKEPARPLDYYQLLRLERFEDNVERIRRHYRKMNAHTRKYAAGQYASLSQQLLNELARAMLCLTDAARKAEYDASLGRQAPAGRKRHTFEELLLLRQVVDRERLDKARNYANATHMHLRDAVLQQKLGSAETLMQVYAESLGLPYLELADVTIEPELVGKLTAVSARTHSCVPVMVDDNQLLVASPNPLRLDVEEDLRLRVGMPIRMVLCTPADVNRLIEQYYTREAASEEVRGRTFAPQHNQPEEPPKGLGKMWANMKKWGKK
ncbi:MAG: hypothetical protein K8T25_23795 [Planctomycetia bacterium]|nr:hypothetical protein [Planctomycetia bacterium]